MSKTKSKTFTAEALEAAEKEKAKAEQAVIDADREFETGGRTAEQHQRTVAARDELAFHVRVHALAVDEHAAFERDEAARVAADIEAQRVADLAKVEDELQQNIEESIAAGHKLITGMARGWSLTILAQSLGKKGPNAWQYEVGNALARHCVAEGLHPRAVIV